MDTIEAIRTRRSIRRYTGEPVADDVLSEILTAAMSAPSAGNQQPWQFVVVAERALREAIAAFHPYAQMVLEAPVAIVVGARINTSTARQALQHFFTSGKSCRRN